MINGLHQSIVSILCHTQQKIYVHNIYFNECIITGKSNKRLKNHFTKYKNHKLTDDIAFNDWSQNETNINCGEKSDKFDYQI